MATRTTSDENLALARTIQITPAHEGLPRGCYGLVAAEPHPAGWFISARVSPDLRAAELDDFIEFVTERAYRLLEHGPQSGTWKSGIDGIWRTYCDASEFDVSLERISA
jgi:hypothetical protein